jgi:hypothetical protein
MGFLRDLFGKKDQVTSPNRTHETQDNKLRELWDRADSIGREMVKQANTPGGNPFALVPQMRAVFEGIMALDKREAKKLVLAVKGKGLPAFELYALCEEFLGKLASETT